MSLIRTHKVTLAHSQAQQTFLPFETQAYYLRFRLYAILENKTPRETFLKFLSVLCYWQILEIFPLVLFSKVLYQQEQW